MRLKDLFEKKVGAKSATVWVILYTSDKVILGKRAPTTNNPNQWNFFGGHVDEGETVAEAAVRELFEETSYQASIFDLKEITTIENATYFSIKVADTSKIHTTDEVSRVKGFKLTDLPDNLHAKTETFFSRLDTLLA